MRLGLDVVSFIIILMVVMICCVWWLILLLMWCLVCRTGYLTSLTVLI